MLYSNKSQMDQLRSVLIVVVLTAMSLQMCLAVPVDVSHKDLTKRSAVSSQSSGTLRHSSDFC